METIFAKKVRLSYSVVSLCHEISSRLYLYLNFYHYFFNLIMKNKSTLCQLYFYGFSPVIFLHFIYEIPWA